jgi:hypothetical protein
MCWFYRGVEERPRPPLLLVALQSAKKGTQRRSPPVDLNTLIVVVFCLVDHWLEEQKTLRQRAPEPELSDAEAWTLEIVDEHLGIDSEK